MLIGIFLFLLLFSIVGFSIVRGLTGCDIVDVWHRKVQNEIPVVPIPDQTRQILDARSTANLTSLSPKWINSGRRIGTYINPQDIGQVVAFYRKQGGECIFQNGRYALAYGAQPDISYWRCEIPDSWAMRSATLIDQGNYTVQLVAETNVCIQRSDDRSCDELILKEGHLRALYGELLQTLPAEIPTNTIIVTSVSWCEPD